LKKIIDLGLELLSHQHFDSLAVGVVDFKNKTFERFEVSATNILSPKPYLFFDLASLTKPLTNSAVLLKEPKYFSEQEHLLLNHRAGLPSGGLLSKKTWREEILSYEIKPSETLYSDYSSLRCMLEIEKKSQKKLKDLCSYYFDKNLLHWMDLPVESISPEYGVRNKKIVSGEVHDNNCFNLKEFVSHAGLFATIDGLCQSLLNLNQVTGMNEQLKEAFKSHGNNVRFIKGFDHVSDPEQSLAGKGSSIRTFGHLGFVGTSFWINLDQEKGAVILTNGVQSYWYEKSGLNHLRKTIGEAIWKM